MPGPPDARGRGRLRRAGRAGLSALADELAPLLLTTEEAVAIEVHGEIESAVLVPLYRDRHGELHAVLTRRRDDMRRHAGQISFPGGRRDGGEALVDTALREAQEEIGLAPDAVDVAGALEPTPTFVTGYAIYPFVGAISEPEAAWVLSHGEVAEVLQVSVAALRASAGERRLVRKGIPFRTPTYEVGQHLIWGATARILVDLLKRLPA